MSIDTITGIGPKIKTVIGTPPGGIAAGTVNGSAIDRLGFYSCVLEVQTGAVGGGPTTQTLDCKLQHSDVSGSGYVDFVPGAVGSGAVPQITAINTRNAQAIDLRGAKRYICVVSVTAFTGGASPTFGQAVVVILGSADQEPTKSYPS